MSVNNLKEPLKIRAIQLDLARHIEPVAYIFEYIDSSSKNGFNVLVLYLEGRIRTKSFPYRRKKDTYSPEEMLEVVKYASKKGMEVIPVIPALGHAGHILSCKEMMHLSEERDGIGRFGAASPSVFCISQEETYAFLENYFAEIAEIFPGKNFHAGLDEAWNFGFCQLCSKKWQKEGLGKMFLGHLEKLVNILAKLGKRMWMWDDMFEIFPEELKHAPKSIVMCHWNYDGNIEDEGSQGHFVNRFRQDWLKEYEKLGIDAVVCPWDRYEDNIESITRHAKSRKVLGGLLTQWGASPRFFAEQPIISKFTGKLWSGDSLENSWSSALNGFYKGNDKILKRSVKTLVSIPKQNLSANFLSYMSGSTQREEMLEQNLVRFAFDSLSERLKTQPAVKRRDFDKILWSARKDLIFWELRESIPQVYSPLRTSAKTDELRMRLASISSSFKTLMKILKTSSEKWNLGINSDDKRLLEHYDDVSNMIADLSDALKKLPRKSDWIAVVRLHLQDFYGSPRLKISAVLKNSILMIAEGNIKPNTLTRGRTGGHYDYYFPFKCGETPDVLLIEGWGYGGQGISFLELKNVDTVYSPVSIKSIKGPVLNASAILTDDSSFATLGRTDIRAQMLYPELADDKGVIECKMENKQSIRSNSK
jgi:hypothetical protein